MPRTSAMKLASISERRRRSRRGLSSSSRRIRVIGTRKGPNTFGSLNRPLARWPSPISADEPGKWMNSAADAATAEKTAAAR